MFPMQCTVSAAVRPAHLTIEIKSYYTGGVRKIVKQKFQKA